MNDGQRLPYVVVRYHHDPLRHEGINVGIVVQTPEGLKVHAIESAKKLGRSYPFLDLRRFARNLGALKSELSQDEFRVLDPHQHQPVHLKPGDPRLLSLLGNEIGHGFEFTEPRYAELGSANAVETQRLAAYLMDTLVEPPRPLLGQDLELVTPRATRAHTILHRAAKRSLISAARKAGFKGQFTEAPTVSGKTRKWTLDLEVRPRSRPAGMFLQHILVLPDVEETYQETAAIARIWQDIQQRQERRSRPDGLTAVYYSKNGVPRRQLKAAEELLAEDKIKVIYAGDLPAYYKELAGQQRL